MSVKLLKTRHQTRHETDEQAIMWDHRGSFLIKALCGPGMTVSSEGYRHPLCLNPIVEYIHSDLCCPSNSPVRQDI